MLREVLHSKIHMARVTQTRPDYVGSITIDANLLDAVHMRVSDSVIVANCRTGERFQTYVFLGERGSGAIEINGAAAHLAECGDQVIIFHYALLTDEEYPEHRPRVATVTDDNQLDQLIRYEPSKPPTAR